MLAGLRLGRPFPTTTVGTPCAAFATLDPGGCGDDTNRATP